MATAKGRSPGPGPGVALFAWVKQELLDAIARGEFSPDEPFVTQREIVERFGVSTTTAVRALNELVASGIVVRRRGRGTFVAQRPPPRAAAPTGQPALGYVSPDSGSVHDAEVLSGIAAQAAELGYRLMVAHTATPRREDEVLRQVAADGARGVVFFPHDRSTAQGAVDELRRAGVPVVLVDRYFPGLPTDAVIFDDLAIGYEVTAAVLERGHREVAVLWSESDATSVRDRLAGHRRALREHGLPELPARSGLRIYDGLEEPARRHRLRSLLEPPYGVTALICGNAPTLALAVTDLLAMETGFPGTVELASMDSTGPYDISPLAIAAAQLPERAMGREAVALLHQRIEGSGEPARHVVLRAEVHVADRGRNTLAVIGAPPEGT